MTRHVHSMAFVAALCWLESAATGATLIVDFEGGADYTDIQSALDAAATGDTVLVRSGEYVITEPLSFNRLHVPWDPGSPPLKDLVVRSETGPGSTTIKMSATPRQAFMAAVVIFQKGETGASVLEGFTLTGGGLMRWGSGAQEEDRGGVFCVSGSSPMILECRVTRSAGHGIFCAGSTPRVMGCEISNHAHKGFVCTRNSSPILTDCVISRNTAGGFACEDSHATVANCAIVQNSASAIGCGRSNPSFTNCTITGNAASTIGVIYTVYDSSPSFLNCIIWDNPGNTVLGDWTSTPVFSFSCIESPEPWPGQGNINTDPRFCGWPAPELWVDAAHAGPGFGTQADPYPSLALALAVHRTDLRPDSPCLGSGQGGTNMGCDSGPCEEPGSRDTIVYLAPGSYSMEGCNLSFHASLRGSGAETTQLEGPVQGSRTGTTLEDLAVVGSMRGGIAVSKGQAPAITNCRIANNMGSGVFCGMASSPILTNCTICDNSLASEFGGGGVHCYAKACPTLIDCTITRNTAMRGGGLSCEWESSPTLLGCSITDNHAQDAAGGVYCTEASAARLTDCLIARNSAEWTGGGVVSWASPMTLTRCTITANSGTGVACSGEPSATLINCTISDNQTEGHAGGISCAYGSPLILNCVIAGNRAGAISFGGGLHFSSSSARIIGCLIVGNSAGFGGGASFTESSPAFLYCTIAENWAPEGGALLLHGASDVRLKSCILWDNTTQPVATDEQDHLAAWFSCIDPVAGLSGENNVYTDPLFTRPGRWAECESRDGPGCIEYEPSAWHAWSSGDYYLRLDSPVIDVAECEPAISEDMTGYPRSSGGGCDMGALENWGPRLGRFLRGDTNYDLKADIGDAIAILGFLFLGQPDDLACPKSADVDDGGTIDIADAIGLLGFLFLGANPPASPFPDCGFDSSSDTLRCDSYVGCP